jgi:hypothetical protein
MLLVALLGGSCATPESQSESPATRCSDPRPQVCTREYMPVCGYREDGSTHTYGNDCTACSDANAVGHTPGACP